MHVYALHIFDLYHFRFQGTHGATWHLPHVWCLQAPNLWAPGPRAQSVRLPPLDMSSSSVLQRLVPRHVQWWRRSRYHRNQHQQPASAAKMVVPQDLTVAADLTPKIGQEQGKYWNRKCMYKMVWKMSAKWWRLWFFRCKIVECKSPSIQKQYHETVINFEM